MADLDAEGWSGEGLFTQLVIDRLRSLPEIASVRVEDAAATRSEADYNFISNEIYVRFAERERVVPVKRLGVFPGSRTVVEPATTFAEFAARLEHLPDVGAPDYEDEGMVQYLRTERVIPPYQTRGYKLVEMVRIYQVPVAGLLPSR